MFLMVPQTRTDRELRDRSLSRADRLETAKVIVQAQADVVALQEVFDLAALNFFHDQFLLQAGARSYSQRFCSKGNDGRGLNVAALSRRKCINVRSHANVTGADLGLSDLPPELRDHPIFRRDCLELGIGAVTLFVCHFKAPYPDLAKAHAVREAEARAVRKIVEARFQDPRRERWIILGDFNEPARSDNFSVSALEQLKSGFALDLLDRLAPGTDWTYEVPGTSQHSRPDRILVSPWLAQEFPDSRPRIIRSGMEMLQNSSGDQTKGILAEPHASDHALVFVDFPGL